MSSAPDPIRAQAHAFGHRMLAGQAEALATQDRRTLAQHKAGDEHHAYLAARAEWLEATAARLNKLAGEAA